MTSSDLIALDTNVLVYAMYDEARQFQAARSLVDRALEKDATFCVTPQILAEFYSVVTDKRRVTEAKSPSVIVDVIARLLAMPGITLLPTPTDLVRRWTALACQHAIVGSKIFDVQIAATMLGNGVHAIYTFSKTLSPKLERVAEFNRRLSRPPTLLFL